MRSATDFLPLIITWFINFARVTLPNFGSGSVSRLATTRLLGILIASLQELSKTTFEAQLLQTCLALLGCTPKTLNVKHKRRINPPAILLRTFSTVFGTTLSTLGNTRSIQ